jgi:hypothetical protein
MAGYATDLLHIPLLVYGKPLPRLPRYLKRYRMIGGIGFNKKYPFEKPFIHRAKFYVDSALFIPEYRTPRIARYRAIARSLDRQYNKRLLALIKKRKRNMHYRIFL